MGSERKLVLRHQYVIGLPQQVQAFLNLIA